MKKRYNLANLTTVFCLFLALGSFLTGCNEDQGVAEKYDLSVNVSPEDAGSVTLSEGTYDAQTSLETKAVPADGYKFEKWTGSVISTDNPLSIIMDEHKVLTANFVLSNSETPNSGGGGITTSPTSAPTPPTRSAGNVISFFSDAYLTTAGHSVVSIDSWSAAWDDSNIDDIVIDGNNTKKITFTNFIGVEFLSDRQDISSMTHFHMDFWTSEADLIGKVFNSKFSQWGGGTEEVSALELNVNTGTNPAIVSGTWVSIDVPISNFSNNANRDDLVQLVITSNMAVVYIDNIYFYKQ